MHYFIISGETSGDLHGSHLITALKELDSDARFTFLGGDRMAEAAGTQPLVHINQMAYMGFSEVLRNLGKVRRNLRTARKAVRDLKPDCVILIDYPSFNLKVAAVAAKCNIPVYYYISPKIWAWKKWRIRDIRRLIRRVYSILPFEPDFYRANNFDATYVGNPSREQVDERLEHVGTREDFLKEYRLRDRPLVAIMPGSRLGEIRNNLGTMLGGLHEFPQYRGVIIGAPGIDDEVYRTYGAGEIPVIRPESAIDVLAHCRAAIVTSGTATLECALAGIPQVVTYRANGSKLSYNIMKRLLSVNYVSLPNLIVNREVIPEQLLHLCTSELIAEKLGPLLRLNTPERDAQLFGYAEMRNRLGTKKAATTTATAIYDDLRTLNHR